MASLQVVDSATPRSLGTTISPSSAISRACPPMVTVRINSSFDRYFPRVDYRKTAVSNSGFDERITGGSDDASASIAGIDPRPGYLRRPRWRHVVVSVRYGRRRWSRRIGDWQHGHQWGGTDAARHWNALGNTRKLRSSHRTNVEPSDKRSAGSATSLGARDRPNRVRASVHRPALCRSPLRRLPANRVHLSVCARALGCS
jgi:hypothetical protein